MDVLLITQELSETPPKLEFPMYEFNPLIQKGIWMQSRATQECKTIYLEKKQHK